MTAGESGKDMQIGEQPVMSERPEIKAEEKELRKDQKEVCSGKITQSTGKTVAEKSGTMQGRMARVDAITAYPLWRKSVARIAQLEATREFCRHDVTHFLDVARLAWIENLERGLEVPKEEIYAAALLHDIGRHLQYEKGIPHDEASVQLGGQILSDCGFSADAKKRILEAIGGHRNKDTKTRDDLCGLIYRADKGSRMCLLCRAEKECNWSEEKKNRHIC